jgi:hypothetical protein
MWFECTECLWAGNTPAGADRHAESTGHYVELDSYDWTDE